MSQPSLSAICPYCGHAASGALSPCPQCGMHDSPATRAATTSRVGPWFVLQPRNPAAPGMNFATLLSLVRRGQVTPESVIRGPTTQQLWARADRVKGLSRAFGICWSCAQTIDRGANLCPHCQKMQEPPIDPNVLIEGKTHPPPRQRTSTTLGGGELGLARASLPTAPSKQGRILTPKELAAAFALDAPPATPATIDDLGISLPSPPAKPKPPRKSAPKFLLSILAILALSIAAYLATDPTARHRALAHLGELRAWAESYLTQPAPKPPEIRTHAVLPTTRPAVRERPREDPPAATAWTTPPPQKSVVVVGPPTDGDPPLLPATQAAGMVWPSVVVEPVEPVKEAVASAEDMQHGIDLFRQALEAESRHDYAGAVRLYQRIRDLPKGAWPASLERRLASAQLRTDDGR